MNTTTYHRRKETRPDEIIAAAFQEFTDKGYAETRLQDVARRAGVSKGLPYLYFKTKEDLFKAVIKTMIKPGLDQLFGDLHARDVSVKDFLRGPFLRFAKSFVKSRRAHLVRLLIAEGHKHPDLTKFYAESVLQPALSALSALLQRAINNGEINNARMGEYPQLVVAPVIVGALWQQLFADHLSLDTDAMLEAHVENTLVALALGPRSLP